MVKYFFFIGQFIPTLFQRSWFSNILSNHFYQHIFQHPDQMNYPFQKNYLSYGFSIIFAKIIDHRCAGTSTGTNNGTYGLWSTHPFPFMNGNLIPGKEGLLATVLPELVKFVFLNGCKSSICNYVYYFVLGKFSINYEVRFWSLFL